MRSDPSSLVSVIVPICNVERWLPQCLDSILAQTHRELDVILLNDGSKDGSLTVMREYEGRDARVRVVDKPNEGYGATCNLGIEMARGAWISIIEPDDFIDARMYEEMLALAGRFEEPIDIIKTPWTDIHEWDDPAHEYTRACGLKGKIPTSTRPFTIYEEPVLLEMHPSIWSCLYRRDFLNEHGIRFVPYPGAGWADNPFLMETMLQAGAIVYLDKPFYNYRIDLEGSTLNHATPEAVQRPFDRWVDMMGVIKRLGVTDQRVLDAHYVRGINYCFGAIHDDGWDNPLVRERVKQVFGMMDPEAVLRLQGVAPHRKRFFFEALGKPVPRIPRLPWARHLAEETVWTVRNVGVLYMLSRVKRAIFPTEPTKAGK